MMLDGTHPTYADTTGSEKMFYRDMKLLIIRGNNFNDKDELSLISDKRQFNICGKSDMSESDIYWKASIISMDTESARGAHERRHYSGDYDATNRISYATFISTIHIIKITIHLIEKYGLKQCVDFKVPSKIWVSLQFTSKNGQ